MRGIRASGRRRIWQKGLVEESGKELVYNHSVFICTLVAVCLYSKAVFHMQIIEHTNNNIGIPNIKT